MLDFLGRGSQPLATERRGATFSRSGRWARSAFRWPITSRPRRPARSSAAHDDRSAIMIFNLGAPSQLDTFDMKPDAPAEIRGPFKPISTASPDIQISEIFPLHAKIADKFSLVRSCHHSGAAVHDAGRQ